MRDNNHHHQPYTFRHQHKKIYFYNTIIAAAFLMIKWISNPKPDRGWFLWRFHKPYYARITVKSNLYKMVCTIWIAACPITSISWNIDGTCISQHEEPPWIKRHRCHSKLTNKMNFKKFGICHCVIPLLWL